MAINKNIVLLFVFLGFGFLFQTNVSVGMSLFQNEFEKRWDDLSTDVDRLNEYVSSRPVELRNVQVGAIDLEGVKFFGATFTGVEWNGTNLKGASFNKATFKACKFMGSLHQGSVFSDVIFENCTFDSAEFGRSTFVNVQFKNSNITDSRFRNLQGNDLVFESSHLKTRTTFAGSAIPMTFLQSNLEAVSLMGLKGLHKLSILDSTLSEVNFGHGNFSDIVIKKSKQSGGGARFNNITAKNITFEDVDMTKGMAIARSQVGMVRVSGGRLGVAFAESTIPKIYIRDAELFYLDFAEAKLDYVEIANCNLYDTGMWDGYIDQFLVKNSKFTIIDGENFKADISVWDNVTLDGEINLTNAQVKDFRPTRLKRGPNLNLITTGSNLRIDLSGE